MIIVRVRVKIQPDKRQQFIDISTPLIAQTNAEPGCLFYSCYQDLADPNLFMFYEEYEDMAAIDYHNQTAHRIAWWQAVQAVLAEPMEAKVLSNSEVQVIIIRD
jgi:quinol monooxygenase YgiN